MCTVFGKVEKDGIVVGRSFDWVQYGGNICFVPSYRSYGINTIGCSFIEQMGEDRAYEGINEEGLFVAVVALPTMGEVKREVTPLRINSLSMVRYILERARSVDEAFYIAKSFTIDYRIKYGWPKVQYFFADSQNKVGIYEEGVFEEKAALGLGEYRIITNKSVNSDSECRRFNKIQEILNKNSSLDDKSLMDIISKVKQEKLTAWSSVYNITERSFTICIEQNFENKYSFNLVDCLKQGRFSIDFAELKLNTKVLKRKRNQDFSPLEISIY
jgi:penicillin V acylase-like amidase (Ntn superfamily)